MKLLYITFTGGWEKKRISQCLKWTFFLNQTCHEAFVKSSDDLHIEGTHNMLLFPKFSNLLDIKLKFTYW